MEIYLGHISSNGGCSIAMLVHQSVFFGGELFDRMVGLLGGSSVWKRMKRWANCELHWG